MAANIFYGTMLSVIGIAALVTAAIEHGIVTALVYFGLMHGLIFFMALCLWGPKWFQWFLNRYIATEQPDDKDKTS